MRAHPVLFALALSATLSSSRAAARSKHKSDRRQRHRAIANVSLPESAPPAATSAASEASQKGTDAPQILQSSYEQEAAGHYREALTALDALPADERGTYLPTLRRAWLLHLGGREIESWAAYAKARALEQDSVEARLGAMLPAMALRRWSEVESLAKTVLATEPGNYFASLRLASAAYNLGRPAEAEAIYRKLLARYPSDADVRAGLGWCLFKQGKRAEARREFLQALASAPRSKSIAEGLRLVAQAER
jgi:tetratricopeptide (TPR) repeat protein